MGKKMKKKTIEEIGFTGQPEILKILMDSL
jgi:hypothetical protein